MSGATSRGMVLILNKISTPERVGWIKWKRSEVKEPIGREICGVSFDEPFLDVLRR